MPPSSNNNNDSVLRGNAAQLSGIRAALSSSSSRDALLTAALEPFLRYDDDDVVDETTTTPTTAAAAPMSRPLHQNYEVTLTWQTEDDGGSSAGFLVITRRACLFCATDGAANDWCVPATSITLHALTAADDDELSGASSHPTGVYIQIDHPDDDKENPMEWTITGVNDASALFAAVSQLVSLNPIDPHQDTNELYGDDENDENFEPEDMIWASDIRGDDNDDDSVGATQEERQAMLDRLDQVLTIPPEYEINDAREVTGGQFDDADEDDEIL